MKKFMFPLERVLRLRQTQARVEESKLERLHRERTTLEALERSFHEQRLSSGSEICARGEATANELAALDVFGQHVQTEIQRTERARAECQTRIAAQMRVLMGAQRNVKLLEKLKSQRQSTWDRELEREVAQQAEESHLAKWNRENIK
jgi:flagellar export protein FliJ